MSTLGGALLAIVSRGRCAQGGEFWKARSSTSKCLCDQSWRPMELSDPQVKGDGTT